MKKIFFITIGLALNSILSVCFAQSAVTISKPQLKLTENNVTILYDILNSDQADKFNISLEVTDSEGKQIYAKSISGDVGESVSGGPGKEINWNLSADNIYLEAMLYFQVNAKVVRPENSPSTTVPAESTEMVKGTGSLSRSSVILQSLLMPGLGLSRMNQGKPHWLKGVAGYGCLSSFVIFDITSTNNHDAYLQTTNLDERDDFFTTSTNQKKISTVFLYSAIGIWAVDFIWTMAGSKKLSKNFVSDQTKGFSIQPSYDTKENAPLLSLRYNF